MARADLAVTEASGIEPIAYGAIGGTVKADGGQFIVGATVTVQGDAFSKSVETGGDGAYLIEEVPVGEYNVTASAEGFYSNSAQETVIEGQLVDVNFILQPIPTYTVSGTVKDIDTVEPLAGATVVIDGTSWVATTDENGYYMMVGIVVGEHTITASKVGYNSMTSTISIVDADITNFDFALSALDESAGPVIVFFEPRDTSNPAWARVTVDWTVSHSGGKLATVETVMWLDNREIFSQTSSVSGSEASGTHELRNHNGHGQTYVITLTVTDTDGKTISEAKEIYVN